jgi:hypothetical protein
VDPFGSSQLDLFDGPPRSAWSDQLGFVQTVDRLGQRVVIGLPTAPTEGWIPASASRSEKRIEAALVTALRFSSSTQAAKHFGVTAKRDEYPAARVTTLRLPAPYHLTHGKRNPIAAWLDGLGLFDERS